MLVGHLHHRAQIKLRLSWRERADAPLAGLLIAEIHLPHDDLLVIAERQTFTLELGVLSVHITGIVVVAARYLANDLRVLVQVFLPAI